MRHVWCNMIIDKTHKNIRQLFTSNTVLNDFEIVPQTAFGWSSEIVSRLFHSLLAQPQWQVPAVGVVQGDCQKNCGNFHHHSCTPRIHYNSGIPLPIFRPTNHKSQSEALSHILLTILEPQRWDCETVKIVSVVLMTLALSQICNTNKIDVSRCYLYKHNTEPVSTCWNDVSGTEMFQVLK